MAEKLKFNSIGSGTPLVLIHGWGLNSGIFQPMAERLAEHFQVTLIDLPGFGQNHHIHIDDYSLDNIATMVADTITEPAIIAGWSLGGLVATQVTLKHSDKVLGLVSINSSPYFVEDGNWLGIKPAILTAFHQQLSEDGRRTIEGFLRIQAMGSVHVRHDIKEIRRLIAQYDIPSSKTLDESLLLLENTDLREKLSYIDRPVFRMYGKLDSLIPKAVIEQIDELFKNSDRYTFAHASHAPFISHSDEFYQVLIDWIAGNIKN